MTVFCSQFIKAAKSSKAATKNTGMPGIRVINRRLASQYIARKQHRSQVLQEYIWVK